MQGSASSGTMALCGGGIETPSFPPGLVINDYTTGYYGALAIQAAVLRRMKEGGEDRKSREKMDLGQHKHFGRVAEVPMPEFVSW